MDSSSLLIHATLNGRVRSTVARSPIDYEPPCICFAMRLRFNFLQQNTQILVAHFQHSSNTQLFLIVLLLDNSLATPFSSAVGSEGLRSRRRYCRFVQLLNS